ncbi:uncharacterized protein LOC117025922 [Rhinolophus ferrumequinum]|uniref:uncharacterized protein LOC117025922 n=1 Tax=Rhinolophus ferrumequinum TaxID=59479 RepID=UPI00140F60C1|nr:uncharacterized protein LOC117025922 [Rhinolophus ferrumequinum]
MVLSLSSMLGTGVWAEGDLRPWQRWPEQKLALATSARTWEASAALPIAAGEKCGFFLAQRRAPAGEPFLDRPKHCGCRRDWGCRAAGAGGLSSSSAQRSEALEALETFGEARRLSDGAQRRRRWATPPLRLHAARAPSPLPYYACEVQGRLCAPPRLARGLASIPRIRQGSDVGVGAQQFGPSIARAAHFTRGEAKLEGSWPAGQSSALVPAQGRWDWPTAGDPYHRAWVIGSLQVGSIKSSQMVRKCIQSQRCRGRKESFQAVDGSRFLEEATQAIPSFWTTPEPKPRLCSAFILQGLSVPGSTWATTVTMLKELQWHQGECAQHLPRMPLSSVALTDFSRLHPNQGHPWAYPSKNERQCSPEDVCRNVCSSAICNSPTVHQMRMHK